LIFNAWILSRIWQSDYLTVGRKIINSVMLFLIPVIWGLLVITILSPPEQGTSSKRYRENKRKYKWKNQEDYGNGA